MAVIYGVPEGLLLFLGSLWGFYIPGNVSCCRNVICREGWKTGRIVLHSTRTVPWLASARYRVTLEQWSTRVWAPCLVFLLFGKFAWVTLSAITLRDRARLGWSHCVQGGTCHVHSKPFCGCSWCLEEKLKFYLHLKPWNSQASHFFNY